MDVKGVSNRPVEMTPPTGERVSRVENREMDFPAMDTVSSLTENWKVRIKNIDSEIRDLQEKITIHQLKREGLASLQMELMDVQEADTETASKLVHKTINEITFNDTALLSDFEMKPGISYYDYLTGIETEKNRLLDDIHENSHDLKSKMIEKENILFASNNIDPEEMRSQRMTDIQDILSSLGKDMKSDNSYITKLLQT
jgi:hypothetical protein